MSDLSASVRSLIESGHAFIKIDDVLVKEAVFAWKQLQSELLRWPEGFPVIRHGEPEPDLGLIVRPPKEGSDYKYFLHVAHDLYLWMTEEMKLELLGYKQHFIALDRLRNHLNEVALQIGKCLDEEWSELFSQELSANIRSCAKESRPYATTTLRSLWYPSAPFQSGARIHIDRNLLSLHLGDEGGALFGYENEAGDGKVSITPPPGYATVFLGVKALYLSQGRLKPFWHGSTVDEGGSRLAMVQFVQADIGFEISDAKKAYRDFYKVSL